MKKIPCGKSASILPPAIIAAIAFAYCARKIDAVLAFWLACIALIVIYMTLRHELETAPATLSRESR